MRLDPLFALMEDWADGKVMLSSLNACSISVSRM